ncbi:MAG: glycosyltransferase family 4 protein [Bacteroidota bacterium]
MGRKIRVLEMIDEATLGGGQMHVLSLVKHIDPDSFEVLVACEGNGFLVDETRKLGKTVLPVAMENRLSFRTMWDVVRTLRLAQCDILHTHGGTSGFWGRVGVLFGGFRMKTVHTYHGFHYLHDSSNRSKLLQRIDRWLLRHTDRVICVCQSDYKRGIEYGLVDAASSATIHNGIEVEKFRFTGDRDAVRQSLGVRPTDFLFGNIGRLHKQKGQEFLLDAFRTVVRRHPHSRLVIVGEGDQYETLQRKSKEAGIDSAVVFAGSRSDVSQLLAAIDVFVLSSLWEGQPISLLEAMAAGKPIVSTDVDGISDILVDRKNALLVPPGNEEELSRAMCTMIEDEEKRRELAHAARATISESYTARAMADEISVLYRNLTSSIPL